MAYCLENILNLPLGKIFPVGPPPNNKRKSKCHHPLKWYTYLVQYWNHFLRPGRRIGNSCCMKHVDNVCRCSAWMYVKRSLENSNNKKAFLFYFTKNRSYCIWLGWTILLKAWVGFILGTYKKMTVTMLHELVRDLINLNLIKFKLAIRMSGTKQMHTFYQLSSVARRKLCVQAEAPVWLFVQGAAN